MYEEICNKIGFKLEDYQEAKKNFKDDWNAFSVLTFEEKDFLLQYCKEHGIK